MQARALAAICKGFEWPGVVVLYEDMDHRNQFLSYLDDAFQELSVGLASSIPFHVSDNDMHLLKELRRLKTMQTRVFLVHMNPLLGYRFFSLAKRIGLMSEGYVWIISDSLSNFMNSMDYETHNSMQGVLGIRPYVHWSKELQSFYERWKRTMVLENSKHQVMELNVYGLWAYDALTALAIATEKVGRVNSTTFHAYTSKSVSKKTNLRISSFGPQLLQELSRTVFTGLTGKFQLVDRKVEKPRFEIFNVHGSGENTVGFWIPDRGLTRDLISSAESTHSTSSNELKNCIWPGDSIKRPNGWAIPAAGKLRVGIISINRFTEYVNVTFDPVTNHTNATGFAIDIFLASLKLLPFPDEYDFRHYNLPNKSDWNYDDMLHEIPKNFDMVVGATTIWAPRAEFVDFSLPYSESGAILVVRNEKPFDMWIFMKPLRWDLWLGIFVASIIVGIVLRILERKVIQNNEDQIPTRKQKPGTVYWSPVLVLAFPERNMVSNSWSSFVLLFWLFMAFILMQSYSANLSAILTVDQLKFAYSDKIYVGYQERSFMKQFLTEHLRISESRLRSYSSAEEYHHAMSLGSKKGGIDAIFDEIPYMYLLLKKYRSQYKTDGTIYRTGGFGFAFPLGSPLASHFSKAIMDVTQGPDMTAIQKKNFGPEYYSHDPVSAMVSQGTSSLTLLDFAGLFVIIALVAALALFCSETPIGRQFIEKVTCFEFKTSVANLIGCHVDRRSTEAIKVEINQESEQPDPNVPHDVNITKEVQMCVLLKRCKSF